MTYTEFKDEVLVKVKERYNEDYEISIQEFQKNNGTVLDGLIIRNSKFNISPTIYLNGYYAKLEDNVEFDTIFETIVDVYETHKREYDIDIVDIMDFEKCKSKIIYKLVNYEQNAEMLKSVPHVRYLDLAIVFYLFCDSLENEIEGIGTIQISDDWLERWKISKDELFEIAKENTPQILKYRADSLSDIIQRVMKKSDMSDGEIFEGIENIPPYIVLSNKAGVNGASVILYDNLLKSIAKAINFDLFIIPCSIHEVIIAPALESFMHNKGAALKDTIAVVNNNELAEVDVLSNNLYLYSLEKDAIEIY